MNFSKQEIFVLFLIIMSFSVTIAFAETKIDQPTVISAVAPVFPTIAIASNTSGKVVVEVVIDPTGVVTAAQIKDGHPLLKQIQIYEETARRWRFSVSSESKMRTVDITFVFSIMPKGTHPSDLTPVFTLPYQFEVRHEPLNVIVHSDPPGHVRPNRRRSKPK